MLQRKWFSLNLYREFDRSAPNFLIYWEKPKIVIAYRRSNVQVKSVFIIPC